MLNRILTLEVKIDSWSLDQEDLSKLSETKRANIKFLIEYKKRVRKIRILFCGVIPFVILLGYGIFATVISAMRLPWPSSDGPWQGWLFAGAVNVCVLFVITNLFVYCFAKNKYISWEKYRKRLWLIAKEQKLEKVYYRCEFRRVKYTRYDVPAAPFFPFGVQKSLNRLIYFHFYEYISNKAEDRHEYKDTRQHYIEIEPRLNSYDRLRRMKYEENENNNQ